MRDQVFYPHSPMGIFLPYEFQHQSMFTNYLLNRVAISLDLEESCHFKPTGNIAEVLTLYFDN